MAESGGHPINCCSCIMFTILALLIALIDIALGSLTLYLSYFPIMGFPELRIMFSDMDMKDDVAWWGVTSIPFFAILGVWSGLNQLKCLCRKTVETPHIWKFLIFLVGEVAGFALPFYFISDYEKKVNYVLEFSEQHDMFYIVFNLLLLNKITIGLFVYQICSFLVVYRYNWIKEQRRKSRQIRKKQSRIRACRTSIRVESEGNINSTIINQSQSRTMGHPNMEIELPQLPPSCSKTNRTSRTHSVIEIDNIKGGSQIGTANRDISVVCDGLGRVGIMEKHQAVKFERLKQTQMETGHLYEDEEFPANMTSLGKRSYVEWKRPFQINGLAQFFTNGISRFDVTQGELGDCWFLAALANLTLNDCLFAKVVPLDNEWAGKTDTYAGMCHFNFFKDGKWQEVIIDDRLPTRNGKLIFMSSSDKAEFWSALVEKAFAKLYGSYEKLDGNDGIGPAMINLTGGNVKRYNVKLVGPSKLFDLIADALAYGKMVGCCCNGPDRYGIFGGHAYSITHVARIKFRNNEKISCIRIRNPWGTAKEWRGEFSDRHPIWELVDEGMKRKLKLKFQDDGEFWFPLKEVVNYFTFVEVCKLGRE